MDRFWDRKQELLISALYSKPLDSLPVPIKWGQDNEAAAQKAYVNIMQQLGHLAIAVRLSHFIINPQEW